MFDYLKVRPSFFVSGPEFSLGVRISQGQII